jgi:hypothetical protein
MNDSPTTRATSVSLWTLGHRRFYSPLMRAPGGPSAAARMAAPRVRPNLGWRDLLAPAAGSATEAAAGAADRASDHAHGAP